MKLSKLLFENNEPELDDYSSFEEWAEYEAPLTAAEILSAAERFGVSEQLQQRKRTRQGYQLLMFGDLVFYGEDGDLSSTSKDDLLAEDTDTLYEFLDNVLDGIPKSVDLVNLDFWGAGTPKVLYHGTSEDNVADILENGLLPKNDTRGMSNRHIGSSVFLTSEREVADDYGGAVLAINFEAMWKDGVRGQVEVEPDVAENWLRSSVASILDTEYTSELESGMDENTYIYFSHIDPKYIQQI